MAERIGILEKEILERAVDHLYQSVAFPSKPIDHLSQACINVFLYNTRVKTIANFVSKHYEERIKQYLLSKEEGEEKDKAYQEQSKSLRRKIAACLGIKAPKRREARKNLRELAKDATPLIDDLKQTIDSDLSFLETYSGNSLYDKDKLNELRTYEEIFNYVERIVEEKELKPIRLKKDCTDEDIEAFHTLNRFNRENITEQYLKDVIHKKISDTFYVENGIKLSFNLSKYSQNKFKLNIFLHPSVFPGCNILIDSHFEYDRKK